MTIPDKVFDEAIASMAPCEHLQTHISCMLPGFKALVKWAFDESAKLARNYAADIPDADQDVFADLADQILRLAEGKDEK